MRVSVIEATEIDAQIVKRWSLLQRSMPEFANPYFSPYFTMAVASVRDDVFLGVLEEGGELVGFFPFQRSKLGIGRPVGGTFSSYQGVVASAGTEWNVEELLSGLGLKVLEFSSMLTSQTPFEPFHRVKSESLVMELSGGYEAYEKKRIEMGGTQLKRTYRMIRKISKEHPGYRFVRHESSQTALRKLFTWKSEQCRKLKSPDIFASSWSTGLLKRVYETQREDFGGVLSALYVGDQMIAAELGIRSATVWHRWICAYDPEYAQYSPGVILGVEMAKAAAAEGISHLDLGKDSTFYKQSFMTATIPIAEGFVERPSLVTAARHARRDLEAWVRRSPFANIARIPGRWLTRYERSSRFR